MQPFRTFISSSHAQTSGPKGPTATPKDPKDHDTTPFITQGRRRDGPGFPFSSDAIGRRWYGTHTWAANGQWSAWYQNQLTNPDAVPIDSLVPCWASCPSSSSAGVGLVEAASKLVACSAFSLPFAPKPQPQGGPRGDALGEHGNTSTSRQHCRAWKWDLAGISIPVLPLPPPPLSSINPPETLRESGSSFPHLDHRQPPWTPFPSKNIASAISPPNLSPSSPHAPRLSARSRMSHCGYVCPPLSPPHQHRH